VVRGMGGDPATDDGPHGNGDCEGMTDHPEPTFTKSEIEKWLAEIGEEIDRAEFDPVFKFGKGQGIVAVMAKMDNEIRRRKK
jgi:hypothetical protein